MELLLTVIGVYITYKIFRNMDADSGIWEVSDVYDEIKDDLKKPFNNTSKHDGPSSDINLQIEKEKQEIINSGTRLRKLFSIAERLRERQKNDGYIVLEEIVGFAYIRDFKKVYMHSANWMNTRQKRLIHDNFTCVLCGAKDNLQVHHITYENIGYENLEDLRTLCKECHYEKVHQEFPANDSYIGYYWNHEWSR